MSELKMNILQGESLETQIVVFLKTSYTLVIQTVTKSKWGKNHLNVGDYPASDEPFKHRVATEVYFPNG